MEKIVFDNKLRFVVKAAPSISTAQPLPQHSSTWSSSSCTIFLRRPWLASSCCTENISLVHIFLIFRQCTDAGTHTTEDSWWLCALTASGTVRLEKAWSFLCRTSFAVSEEEMTTVAILLSLIDITGPQVLERFVSDWWGLSPSLRMLLMMMGKGRGPGGRLAVPGFRSIGLSLRRWMHVHTKESKSKNVM